MMEKGAWLVSRIGIPKQNQQEEKGKLSLAEEYPMPLWMELFNAEGGVGGKEVCFPGNACRGFTGLLAVIPCPSQNELSMVKLPLRAFVPIYKSWSNII